MNDRNRTGNARGTFAHAGPRQRTRAGTVGSASHAKKLSQSLSRTPPARD